MNEKLVEYLKSGGTLGSLAMRPGAHRTSAPFPCNPEKVFAKQSDALALRLRRIGIRDVVVGISGGLDSALALLVAIDAFKKLKLARHGIHAYSMPGFGTSSRTKSNAELLCEGLGVTLETIPIARSVRMHLRDIGHDGKTPDATYENAQARMRTMILMDKANMCGGIVLGTGDMSEIALGWCTYNGDHMSMFGVNAGVPKTIVRKVCAWWAERKGDGKAAKALQDIIATPISPELVKGQNTEKKLGPYELHDFFIWNFCRNGLRRKELYDAAVKRYGAKYGIGVIGETLDTFLWRIVSQAFKRNCSPDGVRVFPLYFSRDGWWIPSDMPAGVL